MDLSIVTRALDGKATEAESREAVKWLATAEGQQWLSAHMDEYMAKVPFGREGIILGEEIPSEEMRQRLERIINRRLAWRRVLKVAAVLLPLLVVSTLWWAADRQFDLLGNAPQMVVQTPVGAVREVILPDGTRVCLASGSTLRHPSRFGLFHREVEIDGVAWLDVAHESWRDFTVSLPYGCKVEVTGTRFEVDGGIGADSVRVWLDEGRVVFHPGTAAVPVSRQATALGEGQRLAWSARTGEIAVSSPSVSASAHDWQGDRWQAVGAPAGEVARVMRLWYGADSAEVVSRIAAGSPGERFTIMLERTTLERNLSELMRIAPVH